MYGIYSCPHQSTVGSGFAVASKLGGECAMAALVLPMQWVPGSHHLDEETL